MKHTARKAAIVTLALGTALAAGGAYKAADTDGKSLFLSNNCNTCHSITALSIARKSTSDAPDLSGVGLKHNADWIAKYLTKKVELDGEKHAKKFKGTDEELQTISGWLAAQKKK